MLSDHKHNLLNISYFSTWYQGRGLCFLKAKENCIYALLTRLIRSRCLAFLWTETKSRGNLFWKAIIRMMLSQELRALWTWHEKEDTTRYSERYSTIKSRAAATKVRLESPLIWKQLRLKSLTLLSVFHGTAINWLDSIHLLRLLCEMRQTDMETNVNSCLTKWVVSSRVKRV